MKLTFFTLPLIVLSCQPRMAMQARTSDSTVGETVDSADTLRDPAREEVGELVLVRPAAQPLSQLAQPPASSAALHAEIQHVENQLDDLKARIVSIHPNVAADVLGDDAP